MDSKTKLPPKCNRELFPMAEVAVLVYGVPVESSCLVIALARDDHGGQRAAEQVVGVLRA